MKIYSVDGILKKNKPYVELRGRFYEVRDITMRERLAKIDEFKRKQQQREEEIEEEGKEVTFESIQDVIADAIKEALVDVPDEVAESVTQREWAVLQKVLAEIHEAEFPVEVEEVDDVDPNLVGPKPNS